MALYRREGGRKRSDFIKGDPVKCYGVAEGPGSLFLQWFLKSQSDTHGEKGGREEKVGGQGGERDFWREGRYNRGE